MKRNIFILAGLALSTLLMVSCSSENTEDSNGNGVTGKTVFADETSRSRTTGVYNGSGVDYSWTVGDKLWVNNGGTLVGSINSNITGKQRSAKFYFNDTFSASSYKVRYTGENATSGDKVIIAANQTQTIPNDATHIGTDGDCGTADAQRQANGSYTFTLSHKAAYLTFAPFYSNEQLANTVYIKSITVSADENLVGTYSFDDIDGIKTSTISGGSKSVTLTLGSSFIIPKASDYTKNGAIMVVAPGTYHNVVISYEIYDATTGADGYLRTKYNSLTLTPGKNMPFKKNTLMMNNYSMDYYAWGATKPLWYNKTEAKPLPGSTLTPSLDASNTVDLTTTVAATAQTTARVTTAPFADAMNVNEAEFYAFFGDPHYDGQTMWVQNGHVFSGGMWFKKLDKIRSGLTHPAPYGSSDGTDSKNYQINDYWKNWNEGDVVGELATGVKWTSHSISEGRPSNTADYFYLPALGYVTTDGMLDRSYAGYTGAYWLSDGVYINGSSEHNQALCLHFSKTEVGVNVDSRRSYYPVVNGGTLKQE